MIPKSGYVRITPVVPSALYRLLKRHVKRRRHIWKNTFLSVLFSRNSCNPWWCCQAMWWKFNRIEMPVPELPALRSSMVIPWQLIKHEHFEAKNWRTDVMFFGTKAKTQWFHWRPTNFYKEPNHCGVGVVCSGHDLSQQTFFRGQWEIFRRYLGHLFILHFWVVPIINVLTIYIHIQHSSVSVGVCGVKKNFVHDLWHLPVAWMKPSKKTRFPSRSPTSRTASARWPRLVLEDASETLGIFLLARHQGSGFVAWVSLRYPCQAKCQVLSAIWWCTKPKQRCQQHVIE